VGSPGMGKYWALMEDRWCLARDWLEPVTMRAVPPNAEARAGSSEMVPGPKRMRVAVENSRRVGMGYYSAPRSAKGDTAATCDSSFAGRVDATSQCPHLLCGWTRTRGIRAGRDGIRKRDPQGRGFGVRDGRGVRPSCRRRCRARLDSGRWRGERLGRRGFGRLRRGRSALGWRGLGGSRSGRCLTPSDWLGRWRAWRR